MPSGADSQRDDRGQARLGDDEEEYQFAASESSEEGKDGDDPEDEDNRPVLSDDGDEESVKRPKRTARLITEDSDIAMQDIQNGYLDRARAAIINDDDEESPSQGRQLRTRRSRRLQLVNSGEESADEDDEEQLARQRQARDVRANRRSQAPGDRPSQVPTRQRLRRAQEVDSPPRNDRRVSQRRR